jgi:outer membrane biosynthesis protein TonB
VLEAAAVPPGSDDEAAVEAVHQWKYKPMLVDGEPKEVDTTITITFSLKD